MKALFILVILTVFGSITMQQYSRRELINIYELACMADTNVTESEFRKFITNGMKANEATSDIKCMIMCVMEKRGILKKGTFDTERAYKEIMIVGELKGHEDEIKEAVHNCKAEKGCHDCDTAFKITMCLQEFSSRNK
ncbi:general odorant-binding protein 56h-like [Zeugodacus cucurbitae]|uniref:general odorant-binding protein 56h-like n=1 Tax=Zeugodacus cucurbitae TaxID=28588 RepID=UPI00059679F2|nr:general odorant-binding protein 56h-like [Zeugodacus cucurbitae]